MNLITTTQLAARLGVSPQCVRQWIAEGRLKPAATLPNGQHLFKSQTRKPRPRRSYPQKSNGAP